MSAESPRHVRSGGPLTVPSQPPPDRSLIDAVSGFINDVKLTAPNVDPKDVIQWARFETADINEPAGEGDSDNDISPLLLILGYGTGVQVWLIPPSGEAQEVLSWRQGSVRVLRILPTPTRGDCFAVKRPLIALCDSAGPGPAFCSLSFISIRGGEQVKSIKFKNPILDVLANKRSVVVSFSERFAIFDAATLEDRMAVTTCYPCPCPLGGSAPINPLALGDRWLAYADKKLNPSKRSSGGCEAEGQSSYTATVLHAAKSLSKGLRGLGETVAQSLAGTRVASQPPSPPLGDAAQPGVVTILDIEGLEEEDGQDGEEACDPIVAHFVAHSEAIMALRFDASGLVLVTGDRRGHDFHVFRVNPHPCGPALAAVHHLYILHRGDTTARVQDIAISGDCRWAAISTLRGTSHIFALCPYGGPCGVRTHSAPRVVNRLSRFHRSAGLPIHAAGKPRAAPGSPVGENLSTGAWFPNPRLPPYPLPTVCAPLAQLRPTANLATHTITRTSSGRQRLSSLSEDNSAAPLLARAAWGAGVGAGTSRASHHALYLMTASGSLMHLVLHPRPASSVPKEKVSDESPIEVEVEQVAQWPLQRPAAAADLLAPLPPSNPLLQPLLCRRYSDICMSEEERWLAQVEIVTHAGPHRRLWMGPQFVFKTYNCTGSSSSLSEAETVDVEASAARGVARSNPVNMPGARPLVPVLVDSGSASSLEHSPSDSFRRKSLLAETGRAASVCDVQLREDLAEAMKEDHGSRRTEAAVEAGGWHTVALAVDPAGTVVRAQPAAAPPAPDPDDYTRANSDEATFRPVVRAPATLPHELPVCPLPRTTTIPVQSLATERSLPTSDYLAADARLEREIDDARQELPSRYPTLRHSDISDDSSVVNVSSVAVEDRSKVETSKTKIETEVTNVLVVAEPVVVAAKAKTPEPDMMPEKVEDLRLQNIEIDMCKLKCDDIRIVRDKKESKSAKVKSSTETKSIKQETELKKESASSKKATESYKTEVELSKNETELSNKNVESTKKQAESSKNEIASSKEGQQCKKEPEVSNIETEPKKALSEIRKDLTEIKTKIETVKSEKESSKKLSKESKFEIKTSSKKVVQETKAAKDVKTETKSVTKKESKYDDINSTKDPMSESKASSKKQLSEKSEMIPLQTEVTLETKISVKEMPDSKATSKKSVPELITTVETVEQKLSADFPKLKPFVKDKSSDRESSPRKELKESKSLSAWKKDSPKLEWSVKSETLAGSVSSQKEAEISTSLRLEEVHIKTEDQAWDMLLNEPEKQVISVSPTVPDKTDESKSKSKKNRKIKKSQEDTQNKSEDDSFVEIHAIEEKPQPSSGDLVSISMPFEEIESSCSYSSKTKKSRSPKNTIEREHTRPKLDDWSLEDIECTVPLKSSNRKKSVSEIEMIADCEPKTKPRDAKFEKVDDIEDASFDSVLIENTIVKETTKDKKIKSGIFNQENRKQIDKSLEVDVKDVYVIDSTKDDFPEIQITTSRGSKMRKKSTPGDKEKESEEIEVISEKPIKSWSSIAASKSSKKSEEQEVKLEKLVENKIDDAASQVKTMNKPEKKQKTCKVQEEEEPLSLHEELMRICKRTDIMVAQCDAPSGLNFVEEHHSLLQDLPPLELDFGLDDFRLEVMRDSLLDVNDTKLSSPICKIDIDSILSSIKESTSAFNLIDLEKVPDKKEKGFSVVENDKITSQEVKADDDTNAKLKEIEVMDKSSDDENASAALSADSDKEEKKSTGASNVTLPSSKQLSKSKKSRRKKK